MNNLFCRSNSLRTVIAASVLFACGVVVADVPGGSDLIAEGTELPAIRLDSLPDFDSLRDTWGRSMDYQALCELSIPTKAWSAAEEVGDYEKAYGIVSAWLTKCPVSERVHLWAISDLMRMGDKKREDAHRQWYRGLIRSALKTGDGKSPETAWEPISVAEEYSIVQHLGLRAEKQSVVHGPLDRLTVRPKDGGNSFDLYFNPRLHFARMARALGEDTPMNGPARIK